MTIEVISITKVEPINVIVNDLCNHANTEMVEMDFTVHTLWQDAGIRVPDDSETVEVEQCTGCKRWRRIDEEAFHA